jgi:hypothetical protein
MWSKHRDVSEQCDRVASLVHGVLRNRYADYLNCILASFIGPVVCAYIAILYKGHVQAALRPYNKDVQSFFDKELSCYCGVVHGSLV